MLVRLSDENACEQTPKPCGCGGGCNGSGWSGQPVININVDSNNKEGYNTLNPGSITKETVGIPVPNQVVQPQIINPAVIASSTGPASVLTTGTATKSVPKMPAVPTIARKQRVFYPEFL